MGADTKIKERPIIFSAPIVRAILSGRKTQTRRIVKGAPINPEAYLLGLHAPSGMWGIHADVDHDEGVWRGKCPYGVPGHRLWVRETFLQPRGSSLQPCGEHVGFWTGAARDIRYKADGAVPEWTDQQQTYWRAPRPSIHMPRWASRITLEITGIRVERLQSISEEDAIAEGCQCVGVPASLTNRGAFAKLWDSINGPGAWDRNDWVWVMEFKLMED